MNSTPVPNRVIPDIQSQAGLTRTLVGPVTGETLTREDRPDLVVEIDLAGSGHRRVWRGGSGDGSRERAGYGERQRACAGPARAGPVG